MKFAVCTLFLATLLAVVIADNDAGHFIPKAFYTLDANGHKSNVHAVNPHTAHYLRRLRRQVHSVSASSSSVTGVDGITRFTSQTVNAHTPEVSFASRFGGSTGTTGHVVQTTGIIDRNGQVHYNTKEGHF
ncbi:hase und igel [Cochliomyia hominivorax]